MKDIRVNALANMLLRILNIVFPIITNPYLARVIVKYDMGHFSIADAIASLFIPLATLGIYNYGVREISKVKEDVDKRNEVFSELFYVSLVASIMATVAYYVYIHFIYHIQDWHKVYYIMGIQVLAQFLYIEWMNEAFENYTFILYKTIIIRVGMLIALFVFVRQPHDVVPYAWTISIVTVLNFLTSFLWIRREITLVRVPLSNFKKLIRPMIALFLFANAGLLYTTIDKQFISAIAPPEYVTYYNYGNKLAMILAGVVSGAVSVSVPRLGYYLGQHNKMAYEDLVNKGSHLFSFFIAPIGMGLSAIGPLITVIFYGEQYVGAGIITSLFAVRTITWAVEIIFGTQIILIQGYENKLTAIYLIGGVFNVLSNIGLYQMGMNQPSYYVMTTILAEWLVLFLEYRFIKNAHLMDVSTIIKRTVRYTSYAAVFFIISLAIMTFHPIELIVSKDLFMNTISIIVLCVVYYVSILIIRKDRLFYQLFNQLKGRFHGRTH